jgi:hypothetical protein
MGKCFCGDTVLTLHRNGQTERLTASEFHRLIANTTTSIHPNDKKFELGFELDDWEVLTDSGFQPMTHLYQTVKFQVYIVYAGDFTLRCADEHIVFAEGLIPTFVKDLAVGQLIHTESGLVAVDKVEIMDEWEHMYDVTVDHPDHRLYTNGILSHNTALASAYLLWTAIFHSDQTILIASKGMSHATEIMDRIKFAYEELPMWLKPGCVFYNRTTISFDNKSRILSQATTENTGRGYSISCVDGSTAVKIKEPDSTLREIPIEELYRMVSSEIGDSITVHRDHGIKILSSNDRLVDFFSVIRSVKPRVRLRFLDGSELVCTPDHKILSDENEWVEAVDLTVSSTGLRVVSVEQMESGYVYDVVNAGPDHCYWSDGVISHNCLYTDEMAFVSPTIQEKFWTSIAPTLSTGGKCIVTSTPNGDGDLFATIWRGAMSATNGFKPFFAPWHRHPERDEEWAREQRAILGELKFRQECDCEFLSSDQLLISSLVLTNLRHKPPLLENGGFKFWKVPSIGGTYFVGVDIASGIGSDFSTVQVIEFPSMEQIAELRNNKLTIDQLYVRVKWILSFLKDRGNRCNAKIEEANLRKNDHLLSTARRIHETQQETGKETEVYFSYENNGLGQTFTVLMNNDEDFPEVNLISSPGTYGIVTTGKSKAFACIELKRLVEKGLIQFNSETTIFELKNFIAHKNSFAAKSGCTDDLISALLVIMNMFGQISNYEEGLHEMLYSTTSEEDGMDEPMPICF